MDKERKDLLDPATSDAVGAGLWFMIKSALSAIVGFLALEWFKKFLDWWNGDNNEDEVATNDQELSGEEPGNT